MPPPENVLDDEARRRMMAGFRSKDSKPEMLVRRALHRLGFRFRLHRRDLPGKPDIVLPRHHTAILVHGCFWHQHKGCRAARMPRTRQDYWTAKFRRNEERDREVQAALAALGWRVAVIWECEARMPQLAGDLASLIAGGIWADSTAQPRAAAAAGLAAGRATPPPTIRGSPARRRPGSARP